MIYVLRLMNDFMSRLSHRIREPSPIFYPVQILILAVAYYLTGRLGLEFSFVDDNVTLVWFPTGIALAALVLFGYRLIPGVALGAFLVNLHNEAILVATFTTGNTLAIVATTYLLKRIAKFDPAIDRIRDVLALTFLGAAIGMTISATIGVTGLAATGEISWSAFADTWRVWWLGDAMGVMMAAPFLMVWKTRPIFSLTRHQAAELSVALLGLILACWFTFSASGVSEDGFPIVILTFPFLLWIALRFNQNIVTTVTLALACAAILATSQDHGPFAREDIHESLLFLWSYIGLAAVTMMLMAAALAEGKRAESDLHDQRTFVVQMMNTLGQGVTVTDAEGRFEFVNRAYAELLGYQPEDLAGKTPWDLTDVDDHEELNHAKQDRERGATTSYESRLRRSDDSVVHVLITGAPRLQDGKVIGAMAVITDLTERKRAEEAERRFQERLKALHDVSIELSKTTSLDDFSRLAVELGRHKLGFDRLGLYFADEHDPTVMVGSFGIDESGLVRDERAQRQPVAEISLIGLDSDVPVVCIENSPLYDHRHKVVGRGWVAVVYLHDGGRTIGWLNVDNLLSQEFYTARDEEALMLYGAMLSNQISRLQAEATQRYSEEQYRNLVENSNDAIYLLEDGWITFVNPRFAELFGITLEDVRAKKYHMLDLVSPKSRAFMEDRTHHLERGETVPAQFELIAQDKNGVEFEIEVSVNHIVFQGRRITQGIARNIAERKLSENALRQSEARFRSMFEEARIGIVITDQQSYMQSANPAFAQMLGYQQDELAGMSFREVSHPDDVDRNMTLFHELFRGERDNYQFEKRYIHKNGNAIWTQVTVSRFPGAVGEDLTMAMVEDITERKRIEMALRQSEERFRLMFENASIGIVLSNSAGYPVSANSAYINLLGYPKDELFSLSFGALTHSEDVGKNLDLFEKLMSREIDNYSYEKRYIQKNGSPVWVRLNVTLFPVGEDEAPFTIAFVEDINERKQAERAADESRKMLETVINTIPFRVFWKDMQSRYLGSNELFAADAGVESAEAVVGKTDDDLVWAHTAEELQAVDREVIESQVPKMNYDNLYVSPDGEATWFRTSKTPLYNVNGDQLGVLGIYEDITERKTADTALQQSETRFRAVFEGANMGIAVADRQGRIVSANPAFVQMLGYSADELKEMRFSDYSHPDDIEKNQVEFQRLINDEIDGYFLAKRNIRKDGGIVWVHINVTRFPSSIDEDDYVIALMEDVTARKEAEKQALQLAIEQEKVQALAEFVRAASHDLKTPLSVINTSLYVLERSDDPDKRNQKIETIDAQVKYLNKVINQLFTMSNLDSVRTVDFEPVRIDILLRDMQETIYDDIIQKNLHWTIETQTDLPLVEGNAEYLHEAIRNVVENAVRFCDDGGRVEARATCEGDTVLITVQDTGRGISEEDLPHIFERFYKADKARTHDNQGGSGMGLAIAKKVFDIHNGDIFVVSVPGEGTTITMRIPLAQSAELVGP